MTQTEIQSRKSELSYDVVLLAIGTILVMLRSMRILYVRGLPEILTYGVGFFCFLIYFIKNFQKIERLNLFTVIIITLLGAIYMFDRLRLSSFNVVSTFSLVTIMLGAIVLLQCPIEQKRKVYNAYNITIQIMVGIGLLWWILYLCNVPLPYYVDNSDNFYFYHVYYFFNVVLSRDTFDIMPRFAGPFLEPGHLGTMCVFLLYINGFRLKKIGNIVLLLGILFSLSLAAYGLLIGAVIITLFNLRRYVSILVMAVFFVLIGIGAQYFNNGENPVYQLVFSRLELNENGDDIVGNNRTTGFFDLTYDKYLKTNDIWMGVGRRAFGSQSDSSDNVTMGTAGFKRYFYLRGVAGLALILAFMLLYTFRYPSRMTIGFLIIYIIANWIRDYPTKEQWMYLFLLAIPLMYYYGNRIQADRQEELPDDGEKDLSEVNEEQNIRL